MLRTTTFAVKRSVRSTSISPFSVQATSKSVHQEFALPRDIPNEAPQPQQIITQSSNGLRLATYETFGPTSSLSLIVPAGSRYEGNNLGVAHYLKNFAFKTTKTQTPIKIVRESELRGVQLSTRLTREYLAYHADFLRDDLPFVIELLSDIMYNTKFNHWELKSVSDSVRREASSASADPITSAIEAAHRIAFRSGLGNSIFAPTSSKVDIDTIKLFASQNLSVGPKAALLGVGVNHKELSHLADDHFSAATSTSGSSSPATKYYGGEQRIQSANGNHVFVAFKGAANGSKDAATFAVLRALLGEVKTCPHGPGSSLFGRQNVDAVLESFNQTYSDGGLFGIRSSSSSASSASKAISKSLEILKGVAQGSYSEELNRALNQAKATVYASVDSRLGRLNALASQTVVGSSSPDSLVSQIQSVSFSDISLLAQKLVKSKPTLIAVGETHLLPYSDTLGF